ncbi:hypothetical protein JG688_00011779 [Phytophthora aleatoria]|uniref:Uncharacterized protein n=1 Tax=Phytophthora aleatoria TaxID=2496075 RepID=A0A8J5IC08_9STRA|nr:hypothetical protein JG688_00011779 [Phytophthora aleatoria]
MEAALSFIDEFAGELSVEVPSLTDSTTSASSTVSLEELLAPDDEEEASLLPLSDSPVPVDTLVNENLQLNQRQLTPCPTPTQESSNSPATTEKEAGSLQSELRPRTTTQRTLCTENRGGRSRNAISSDPASPRSCRSARRDHVETKQAIAFR